MYYIQLEVIKFIHRPPLRSNIILRHPLQTLSIIALNIMIGKLLGWETLVSEVEYVDTHCSYTLVWWSWDMS